MGYCSAHIITEVQFYDLDPMEIMWHGNYVKLFEEARCALLDDINYNYPQMKASGFAWPVVDMRLKYVRPAVFGKKLKVTATLTEYENRMKITYVIQDHNTGEKLTTGYTIMACVAIETGEMLFETPHCFREKLGECLV